MNTTSQGCYSPTQIARSGLFTVVFLLFACGAHAAEAMQLSVTILDQYGRDVSKRFSLALSTGDEAISCGIGNRFHPDGSIAAALTVELDGRAFSLGGSLEIAEKIVMAESKDWYSGSMEPNLSVVLTDGRARSFLTALPPGPAARGKTMPGLLLGYIRVQQAAKKGKTTHSNTSDKDGKQTRTVVYSEGEPPRDDVYFIIAPP